MKIAVVRAAFFNNFEAQLFYPLLGKHEVTAFASRKAIHTSSPIKLVKLPSPMDWDFGPLQRLKMPVLNRLFIDAHWLRGLEQQLNDFDIAHCSDTYYAFTQQCLRAKKTGKVKAVVATVFENIPFNNEGIWGRKWFKKNAIRNIDHFLAATERAKAALMLEGCDPNKITVFPSFVDTKRFKPGKKKRNEKELTILFVGRLEFYKGVYEIIYAAKRLLSDPQLKDYKLTFKLVGPGSELANLQKLVNRLGIEKNVKFGVSSYDKIPEIYQQADIFVAPSRATKTYQEQFCSALLEAQATGLPIVTTLSGGIPENVREAGLYANPGDFYSLSEQIKKFILDEKLREKYSKLAREQAVIVYDIRLGANQLEAIYKSVLKNE